MPGQEDRERYRSLCEAEDSIPLFSQDWWLDAVCGEGEWDVALAVKGGNVFGAMPYYRVERWSFSGLVQPPLTQRLGPWIRSPGGKYATRLSNQKEVMETLIGQLPPFDYFSQNWDYRHTNWLPFYWNGFEQTTRYTYVLELSDLSEIWDEFEGSVRREIKKAEERYGLEVQTDLSVEALLNVAEKTFEGTDTEKPYSRKTVRGLDAACAERGARRIYVAEDPEGVRHAAVYIVWDDTSAYYLLGGGDPQLRKSGAHSLCMWRAIEDAAEVTGVFDFEGSMIESVERFFRGFGARQRRYFHVTKTPSRILRARAAFRSVLADSK